MDNISKWFYSWDVKVLCLFTVLLRVWHLSCLFWTDHCSTALALFSVDDQVYDLRLSCQYWIVILHWKVWCFKTWIVTVKVLLPFRECMQLSFSGNPLTILLKGETKDVQVDWSKTLLNFEFKKISWTNFQCPITQIHYCHLLFLWMVKKVHRVPWKSPKVTKVTPSAFYSGWKQFLHWNPWATGNQGTIRGMAAMAGRCTPSWSLKTYT